jgi:hypothetical protein
MGNWKDTLFMVGMVILCIVGGGIAIALAAGFFLVMVVAVLAHAAIGGVVTICTAPFRKTPLVNIQGPKHGKKKEVIEGDAEVKEQVSGTTGAATGTGIPDPSQN